MDNTFLVGVTIIIILVYVVHHYIKNAHLTSSTRHLWFSTVIFISIGIAIGPAGLHLLNLEHIHLLAPLLDILLGWIGWLVGIELTKKMLRLIPFRYWLIGMTENFVTLTITVIIFTGLGFLFTKTFNFSWTPAFLLLTGLCAAVSSPRSIITLTRQLHIPRNLAKGYAVIAHLGNLGVMLLMYLFIYFYNWHASESILLEASLKLVVLGGLQGLLMSWLFLYRRDTPESMLILIGVITLFAGAASFLKIPVLIVGVIGGAFYAYFFPNRQPQLYTALQQSERPIYLLFVALVSIDFPLYDYKLYIFLVLFILIRALAKVTSGLLLKKSLSEKVVGGWNIGVFIPQGALAIAIALSAYQLLPNMWNEILMATVVIGLLINELLGYVVIRSKRLLVPYD